MAKLQIRKLGDEVLRKTCPTYAQICDSQREEKEDAHE